jgi:hypothetical protein
MTAPFFAFYFFSASVPGRQFPEQFFAGQKSKSKPAGNKRFGVSGAAVSNRSIFSLLCFCPGLTSNIEHLFLSSSKFFHGGCGSRLDIQ